MRHWKIILLGCGVLGSAFAAEPVASDTAADPAYAEGEWTQGRNGGSGFEGWVFGTAIRRDCTGIASAGMNGEGSSIDSEGVSFFLRDPEDSGGYLDVFRTIPGGLEQGRVLSVDLDVNFRAGYKGLRVLGTNDKPIFRIEVGALDGEDAYAVHDVNGGTKNLSWDYHVDTVLHVELTQTHPAGGTWRVERRGGIVGEESGTYTGTAKTLQFYTFHAGSGTENALIFNNLLVTNLMEGKGGQ